MNECVSVFCLIPNQSLNQSTATNRKCCQKYELTAARPHFTRRLGLESSYCYCSRVETIIAYSVISIESTYFVSALNAQFILMHDNNSLIIWCVCHRVWVCVVIVPPTTISHVPLICGKLSISYARRRWTAQEVSPCHKTATSRALAHPFESQQHKRERNKRRFNFRRHHSFSCAITTYPLTAVCMCHCSAQCEHWTRSCLATLF